MSVLDIKFLDTDSATIYDYTTLETTTVVKVQNLGDDALKDLGVFVTYTSTLGGDVENPPDYTPESAYQVLIDWGQATVSGVTPSGGLKMTYNSVVDNSVKTTYFSRSDGSAYSNRILIGYDDAGTYNYLPSGATITLTLTLETPLSIAAKRLFVNIGVG